MTDLAPLISVLTPAEAVAEKVPDLKITGIECDSRQVRSGQIFVAIRGVKQDGTGFIREAVARGAVFVIADCDLAEPPGVPWLKVADARDAVARLACRFFGDPATSVSVIGVTGTNGKTTTCYLLEHLLSRLGKHPGVLGTIGHRFAGREIPANETTPSPLKIQDLLRQMCSAGCDVAAMEVSSHALDQKRTAGIPFAAAIFTNLTQDHLDYHATLEAYFECKARLFSGLDAGKPAVINIDDEWGRTLFARPGDQKKIAYAIDRDADLRATNLRGGSDGTSFDLVAAGEVIPVELPLVGKHNVYNALGALGALRGLGFSLRSATGFLKDFPGVPGRLESIRLGQDFRVYVDFAHTPDGLENVLRSLQPYRKNRLITVFGCGGDRDRGKRPKMASIASQFSDQVIVTSDNPRSENPGSIAQEICAGFPGGYKNYTVILDRRKAIRQALLTARTGDLVLLAGKGHERNQIVGSEVIPFSDREEVERVLSGR